MTRLLLWLTLALIVATNVFVLAHVAYNRSGEPEAVITLTEREANLSYGTEENSGLGLQLLWQQDRPWLERDPGWFNQAKLESLGFDCSVPLTDFSAQRHYSKALPRMSYTVLEYDGKSWDDWLTKEKARLLSASPKRPDVKGELENLEKKDSRLIAVDVGNDAARLRTLYPDRRRFLIVPAEVHLVFMNERVDEAKKYHKPFVYGRVLLLNQEVHVPLGLSEWLDQIRRGEQQNEQSIRFGSRAIRKDEQMKEGPRYSITLHYGQTYEPWVVGIKPLIEHL